MKKKIGMFVLAALIGWVGLTGIPAYAQDGKFVAVEIQGAKFWIGGAILICAPGSAHPARSPLS